MAEQKRGRNKKAVFFSLDALIALIIILLTITVIYPIIRYSEKRSSVPEDILISLSELKIGDMENDYVTSIRGFINDPNKSVLEQIGEFYASSNPEIKEMARLLAKEALSTIDENENIGIWIGDDPNPVALRNKTAYEDAKNVDVERQIISGIKDLQPGETLTGYSARAFLSNSEQKKYYYFGGYVGEGNITLNVEYSGSLKNVSMEIAASKQFKIYVNDKELPASFEPAEDELEPKYFDLSAYIEGDFFHEGENTFKIVPQDAEINFHVAGGYLKLIYSDGVQYEQPVRYYFPGINGIINLYDSFYVPGNLDDLKVYIKAKVDDAGKKMYMRIGDKLIFNESTGGDEAIISLDNDDVEAILGDYSDYSYKTIPIRIAVEGVDYLETELRAEIFSSVALSGSSNSVNVRATIDGNPYEKIDAVIETNKKLVEMLLGQGNAYIGLTPTRNGIVEENTYHALSQDELSLKSTINEWSSGSTKDICAGIQRAVDEFTPESEFRAIILSVFDAPKQCDAWETEQEFLDGGTTRNERIKTRVCKLAAENNIRFYVVEMGLNPVSEINSINALKDMASCSEGKYVDADDLAGGLMDAYNTIVTEIIDLIYKMQIIDVVESADASSYLSPDSYIEFDYERTAPPYGIVISSEKIFDDGSSGSFSIPAGSKTVEARVISYSGSMWTKYAEINNNPFYNLEDYGQNYVILGDPYAVNIPNTPDFILENEIENTVTLRIGISPTASFDGSPFNKIIYAVVKNMVSYSAISSSADGCAWHVEFEDGNPLVIQVGTSTENCFYTSASHEAPSDDALKIAVYNLFKKIDDDNNGKIDLNFEAQNLQVSSSQITGIPYPWETVIQIRKWW